MGVVLGLMFSVARGSGLAAREGAAVRVIPWHPLRVGVSQQQVGVGVKN